MLRLPIPIPIPIPITIGVGPIGRVFLRIYIGGAVAYLEDTPNAWTRYDFAGWRSRLLKASPARERANS